MTKPSQKTSNKFGLSPLKGPEMATKKELFESAMSACKEHNAPKALVAALTALLEPKAGGASINLDEVTKKVDGKITELQCQVSGVFLPATVEYFYEAKDGKGIAGIAGVSLRRLSRQAESIRKEFTKVQTTSERAIMSDVLDGVIDNTAGKAKIDALKAKKPNFSKVGLIVPEPAEAK